MAAADQRQLSASLVAHSPTGDGDGPHSAERWHSLSRGPGNGLHRPRDGEAHAAEPAAPKEVLTNGRQPYGSPSSTRCDRFRVRMTDGKPSAPQERHLCHHARPDDLQRAPFVWASASGHRPGPARASAVAGWTLRQPAAGQQAAFFNNPRSDSPLLLQGRDAGGRRHRRSDLELSLAGSLRSGEREPPGCPARSTAGPRRCRLSGGHLPRTVWAGPPRSALSARADCPTARLT